MSGITTTTTDSNTYQEVNLNPYSQVQDNDNGGFFDKRTKLFTNSKGEGILTFGDGFIFKAPDEEFVNKNPNRPVPLYDFQNPNKPNGDSFTSTGKDFYAGRDDYARAIGDGLNQTENPYDKWQKERLIAIENELKSVMVADCKRRNKSEENTVCSPLITSQYEPPAPTGIGIDLDKVQANFKKIQPTDTLLQRLSLRNLKYPVDADYGNTQDYIQINQFTYQGVNPSILFPKKRDGETTFDAAKRIAGTTLAGERDKLTGEIITPAGLQRISPKNHHIGLVKLPMPNQLNDSNNVAWGEDQLNALTAAAATLGAGALEQGIQFTENLLNGKYEGPFDFLQQVFGSAQKDGLALVDFLKQASKDQDANLLARSAVGSSLLNLAGFGISPETILARGAGVIPNSNLELLFNAPALRAFRFDWKMSPRSQQEAIRINNIIRFFKQGMAAKKISNSTPGGTSYFLGTPNVFDIHFKTSKSNKEFTNTNHSVLKIKTCACVGAAVNYTPEGMWNAYEKGQPTSCILSLQFKELEPIYNTDYEEDPFAYDNLIGAVPLDAVGY